MFAPEKLTGQLAPSGQPLTKGGREGRGRLDAHEKLIVHNHRAVENLPRHHAGLVLRVKLVRASQVERLERIKLNLRKRFLAEDEGRITVTPTAGAAGAVCDTPTPVITTVAPGGICTALPARGPVVGPEADKPRLVGGDAVPTYTL